MTNLIVALVVFVAVVLYKAANPTRTRRHLPMNKKTANWWSKGKRYPGNIKVFTVLASRLVLAQGGVKLKGDK